MNRKRCLTGLGWIWKCADDVFVSQPLIEYLRQIPDYRCARKHKHDLTETLLCLIIGVAVGRTSIRRSLNWCKSNISWLRKFMKLKNGIASPSTVSRMLSRIDEELALYGFMEWIGEIVDTRGKHLAIDVKALRGATEKTKTFKSPMVMNVIETETDLVLAQFPMKDKTCEITEIPKALEMFRLEGSTVTIDAIGTQTTIMKQILKQGGHFVLCVKKNQPEAEKEINEFMKQMGKDYCKRQKDSSAAVKYPEMMDKYTEHSTFEHGHGRTDYRTSRACTDPSILTKTQDEWPFIKTIGQTCQVRIETVRDSKGNDITPSKVEFLKAGSRRNPIPVNTDGAGKDIQCMGMISDMELDAQTMGKIKRKHWAVENELHHVLDDSFREDRSPARTSRNMLALIRKYAYNLLRLAMLESSERLLMTEMMDRFADDSQLREKYVFKCIPHLN